MDATRHGISGHRYCVSGTRAGPEVGAASRGVEGRDDMVVWCVGGVGCGPEGGREGRCPGTALLSGTTLERPTASARFYGAPTSSRIAPRRPFCWGTTHISLSRRQPANPNAATHRRRVGGERWGAANRRRACRGRRKKPHAFRTAAFAAPYPRHSQLPIRPTMSKQCSQRLRMGGGAARAASRNAGAALENVAQNRLARGDVSASPQPDLVRGGHPLEATREAGCSPCV